MVDRFSGKVRAYGAIQWSGKWVPHHYYERSRSGFVRSVLREIGIVDEIQPDRSPRISASKPRPKVCVSLILGTDAGAVDKVASAKSVNR